MILTEANDLSYVQQFKNAKEPDEVADIIKEFCKSAGFNGYNEEEWNKFIDTNLNSLNIECNKYGLSKDNPFFGFLEKYTQQNGNITSFLVKENWNILHNCVSNGVLETKQLSFKCPEIEQVRILVNPNLWNISPKSDVLYLIKLYSWTIDQNLNTYILNAYVKAAFSEEVTLDNGKIDFEKPDMNKIVNKVGLLKCLFFTDYINLLTEDKIKNTAKTPTLVLQELQKKILNIKSQNMLISHTFESVDLIEQQVGVLREQVQESHRDVDGRYQKTDTEDQNQKTEFGDRSAKFSNRERSNILSKSDSVINAIKSTFNTNNKADIRDILKVLGDSY